MQLEQQKDVADGQPIGRLLCAGAWLVTGGVAVLCQFEVAAGTRSSIAGHRGSRRQN